MQIRDFLGDDSDKAIIFFMACSKMRSFKSYIAL